MTGNLKFQLLFKDRIGIVFDIARLMIEQGLNIIAMEVEQNNGFAKISMEVEKKDHGLDKSSLHNLQYPQSRHKSWPLPYCPVKEN